MFGVFLVFGTFVFAIMRAHVPGLTLVSVFGTIAVDIFCVCPSDHLLERFIHQRER